MILAKDLPIDEGCPESCVYWIHHEDKHADPRVSGYVGVSIEGAAKRFKRHLWDAKRGSKLVVHKALRKYGDKVKIKTLLVADPEFCLLFEEMIRPISNMGGNIWNLGAGGKATMRGYVPTKEAREALSERGKLRPVDLDHLKRMREIKAEMPVSDETRKKLSVAAIARNLGKTAQYPWETNAAQRTKHLWLGADTLYQHYLNFPTHGEDRVATALGMSRGGIRHILGKIKGGWIPIMDTAWLTFKENNKESHETTSTT